MQMLDETASSYAEHKCRQTFANRYSGGKCSAVNCMTKLSTEEVK